MIVSKEEQTFVDTEGKSRKAWTLRCDQCGKVFLRPARLIRSEEHYCSKNCYSLSKRTRVQVVCALCGKVTERRPSSLEKSKSRLYFCGRVCKDKGQSLEYGLKDVWPDHYGSGINNYREKALKYYPNKCTDCDFDDIRALVVHHRDHNRDNNGLKNLEVLCANCHYIRHRL